MYICKCIKYVFVCVCADISIVCGVNACFHIFLNVTSIDDMVIRMIVITITTIAVIVILILGIIINIFILMNTMIIVSLEHNDGTDDTYVR